MESARNQPAISHRLPPQNIEAEQSVLGAMIISDEAIGTTLEILQSSWFYEEAHRKIYSAILNLYNDRRNVDLITLSDKLRNEGFLDLVGGQPYLSQLAEMVPTAANVSYYAQIVKEKGILRNLIKNATQIVSECYEGKSGVDDVMDTAERLIFEVADIRHQQNSEPIKDLVKRAIEKIDRLYQRKEKVTGLETGFIEFDRMTSGLQKADLIILAGRPSMGKSAFATAIVEHIGIHQQKPVVFFSLEIIVDHKKMPGAK